MPGTSRFSILLRCARLTVLLCRATFRASSRMARPTSSPTRRRLSTALSLSGSAASAVSWLRTSFPSTGGLWKRPDLPLVLQDHLPPSRLPSLHSWLVDHQYALPHPFRARRNDANLLLAQSASSGRPASSSSVSRSTSSARTPRPTEERLSSRATRRSATLFNCLPLCLSSFPVVKGLPSRALVAKLFSQVYLVEPREQKRERKIGRRLTAKEAILKDSLISYEAGVRKTRASFACARRGLPLPPHAVPINSATDTRPNLARNILQLPPIERPAPARHKPPPKRDRENEVQDRCHDDEQPGGDIWCVREDGVEVAR